MPFVAVELAVKVRVDVTFPSVNVTLAGSNVAVTPEGSWVQLSDTAPEKPDEGIVTVVVPVPPCLMISAAGLLVIGVPPESSIVIGMENVLYPP